jgi:uncharacterized protein (DUF697 family)
MVKQKSLLKRLPVKTGALTKAIGTAASDAEQQISVRLIVDKASSAQLRGLIRVALKPLDDSLQVIVYSLDEAFASASQDNSLCTLFLGHSSDSIAQVLISELKAGRETLLIADDAQSLLDAEKAWPNLIDYSDVILYEGLGKNGLLNDIAKWFVRKFPKQREKMARSWDFLRKEATDNLVTTTALQNFAIGAIPFLPGADMPLITGNQLRMALGLAEAHSMEISNARIKEIVGILALAVLSRGLSRKLVAVLPFAKWLARGLVGGGATLASGFALQAYYGSQASKARKGIVSDGAADGAGSVDA